MTPRQLPAVARSRAGGWFGLAVGLLFVAGGFWMLLTGSRSYLIQRDRRAHAGYATGTVVDFQRTESYDDGPVVMFAPVFTFVDATSATRRVTSKIAQDKQPSYPLGAQVPILYHRDRPDEAEIDTFYASWGGVLIPLGFSVPFAAIGSLVTVGSVRLLRPTVRGLIPAGP